MPLQYHYAAPAARADEWSLDERIRRGVGREMTMALVSAPSNLGLRPPQPTSVPGCAKAPEALREAGLFQRLAEFGAVDAGVVLPGRYADDAAPGRLRNQGLIVEHARRLAERIGALQQAGQIPLVIGGDCSLLVAAGLALRRAGRYGLAHLDGHIRLSASGELGRVRQPGR